MNKYISQSKQVLSEILFKEFQPYSFLSKSRRDYQSVSNFFPVISNDAIKTRYVFDNAPFFSKKFKEKNVKHLITLYDRNGVVIASRESTCDLPLFNISFKEIIGSKSIDFGSFTHHIKYDNLNQDNIIFHLRGYTYYSSVSQILNHVP